jgi:hypothetical protein
MYGVRLLSGARFFRFSVASRPALGFTQTPIQLVLGAISLGIKRTGREAGHSPPSAAAIKNGRDIPALSHRFS